MSGHFIPKPLGWEETFVRCIAVKHDTSHIINGVNVMHLDCAPSRRFMPRWHHMLLEYLHLCCLCAMILSSVILTTTLQLHLAFMSERSKVNWRAFQYRQYSSLEVWLRLQLVWPSASTCLHYSMAKMTLHPQKYHFLRFLEGLLSNLDKLGGEW